MYAHKLTAFIATAIAAGTLALATAPSEAQTTAVKKKPPTQVAMTVRPPAKVTVRKRSYLDPGTETKAHAEHDTDYAFPPGDGNRSLPGAIGGAGDWRFDWNRMPFPSCFDLMGFCR
jgi:hypothetical protein